MFLYISVYTLYVDLILHAISTENFKHAFFKKFRWRQFVLCNH